ncbi:uncharacterized protein BDV17DRAFT_288442 [Aspergillus undulatus]|uniref:uncharacterized protein n=1 Tax=Aspergillus undulatus TaxID=1810928 RepID=UPI003CCDA2B6
MTPQKNTKDPRCQKKKSNPRRKPMGKPAIINMPHDPDAPIQSIELSSGSRSVTQSCNNDTQTLPPKRFPTPLFCEQGVLFGYWYQDPGGNGSRYPVYACPQEREFTVKRHGRIEPVRIDDFDELDVFEDFVTALFRAKTDRRQKAVNSKLWEFVILLWAQEEYWRACSAA